MFEDRLEIIKIEWKYDIQRRKTYAPFRWCYTLDNFGGTIPQIGDTLYLRLPVKTKRIFRFEDEPEETWDSSFLFNIVERSWDPEMFEVKLYVTLVDSDRFWDVPEENLSRLRAEWDNEEDSDL